METVSVCAAVRDEGYFFFGFSDASNHFFFLFQEFDHFVVQIAFGQLLEFLVGLVRFQ